MTTDITERRERLRRAGLRTTAPRMAVLEALAQPGGHHDADSVAQSARLRLVTLSTQAVYNNLLALYNAGIVRRIELPGQPARYELRVGDNHHHIVCRTCGRTEDVDCAVGAAPCLTPSQTHGFARIDEAEVTFWGVCPTCQSNETKSKTSSHDCETVLPHLAQSLTQKETQWTNK